MRLAHLVDLETQLLRDEAALHDGEGKRVRERDRVIGARIIAEEGLEPADSRAGLSTDARMRRRIALAWLDQIRGRVDALPGERMERGYGIVGWILAGVAVMLGVGTATAVLAYDGREPVNVFHFLAVFVVLQIVLLSLMIVLLMGRRVLGFGSVLTSAQGFVRWLGSARLVDRLLRTLPSLSAAPLPTGMLRSRHHLYSGVEKWMLFTITQRFAAIFNAAALVTCLLRVAFTDLTFSWSTTLRIDGEDLHRWLTGLGFPWVTWIPDSIPSPDVIHKSQWVRHGTSGFVGEPAFLAQVKEWADAWWRYLIFALMFWGLLPRLVAWGVGRWQLARQLASVDLEHASFQRLYERLFPPQAHWESPAPDTVGKELSGVPAPASEARPRRKATPPTEDLRIWVVAWGRLALDRKRLPGIVESRFRTGTADCLAAGGADYQKDLAAIDALVSGSARRVVLLVEPGVQPTKEVFAFLRQLRERVGARVQVVVGIVGPDGNGWRTADQEEERQWHTRLEAEGDPYLRLESMSTGA
jgi:hypothetical protein